VLGRCRHALAATLFFVFVVALSLLPDRTFLIRIPGPIICNCSLPLTRLLVFRQSNAMSSYLLSQYVTEQPTLGPSTSTSLFLHWTRRTTPRFANQPTAVNFLIDLLCCIRDLPPLHAISSTPTLQLPSIPNRVLRMMFIRSSDSDCSPLRSVTANMLMTEAQLCHQMISPQDIGEWKSSG
jgi:hypothetical protein